MKKLILILLLALFSVNAEAIQSKQFRSLSAAGAVTNGASFGSLGLNPPQGGGAQWSVMLTGSAPNLTFQVQGQMTDGTWVPVANPNNTNPTVVLAGTFGTNTQIYNFFGPYIDMRVVITAYTSGTLTADIMVEWY